MHKALENAIPILAVSVASKNYDFADAGELMLHLDTELDKNNPGAAKVLTEIGIDLKRAAWMLSTTIPNVISVQFNPSGSQNSIMAALLDLVEGMRAAAPVSPDKTFEEWLSGRGAQPVSTTQHGGNSPQRSSVVRPAGGPAVPSEVPDLPKGYLVRDTILDGIKALIFPPTETESTAPAGELQEQPARSSVVTVQGMGGSGKTVVAAALVFDPNVSAHFDVIVFLPFGQAPVLRDLQKTMFYQLVKKNLDAGLSGDEVITALADAAKGKKVLCVLDDVWTKEAFQPFSRLLDSNTASRLVATTRIKGLVPSAAEYELGLLSPDDSVSLLLECAGEKTTKPFSDMLYRAVELCGHLPLVISIAAGPRMRPKCRRRVTLRQARGVRTPRDPSSNALASAGILEQQHGGVVDDDFITLLSADNAEVLREGEHGDLLVSIEDRLITASLNSYTGKDKAQVEELFLKFAVFPEDVAVPISVFDQLAPLWAGRDTKRAHLKVRSWVTALIHCSLAKGSLATGVYQHDVSAAPPLPGRMRV